MTRKLHVAAFVAIAALIPLAAAQAQSSTTTTSTTTSFDSLSPGNQKIARALFDAQEPTEKGKAPLDLNQIADLKGKTGWGNVFKEMKGDGLIEAKNLGQVVSGYEHTLSHSAALGAGNSGASLTVTTGSGRTTGPGNSNGGATGGHANAGIEHHEDAATITTAGGASMASAGAINAGGNGVHAGVGGGIGGGRGH